MDIIEKIVMNILIFFKIVIILEHFKIENKLLFKKIKNNYENWQY